VKWAVSFPEESILLVRPCLVALCGGNRPAGKLLSVLIYRYSLRQEHKSDAENMNEVKVANGEEANQDITFRIYRKQSQLVADMCDEVTEKTLHDVAVPTLQLFGYLDVDESPSVHCYDVHIDVVMAALEAYKRGAQQLEDFLIAHVHIQLEKFLINKKKFQLNKKKFLLPLEEVLIANRNFSNNKRGRKPKREAAEEAQSEDPQIDSDCLEIDSEIGNENEGADAPRTPAEILEDVIETHDEVQQELQRITGEHAALHTTDTESHYRIANSAIGKDDFRLQAPGQLTLAAKGATHGNDTIVHLGTGMGHTHGDPHTEDHQQITSDKIGATHGTTSTGSPVGSHHRDTLHMAIGDSSGTSGHQKRTTPTQLQATTEITSQQAPGAPSRPLAVGTADVTSRHGDAGSVQAQPSLVAPGPAQAATPPAAGSGASVAPTAQASGRRRPPRGNKLVPMELSLLGEEVKRWIEEARGVKVHMTENHVRACNTLAEQDGVSLESLKAYFEYVDQKWTVSLVEAAGLTGKESKEFLSFESTWPQLKRKLKGKPAQTPPADWVPDENDYSPKAELRRQEQRARSAK